MLGAWFVGERWISDQLYACCDQGLSSELSAVTSYVRLHGLLDAQKTWERHWSTFITATDVQYLASHHVNAVRIPIGWFSLSDPGLLRDTAFDAFQDVYVNCWSNFVVPFILRCRELRIGVLVDLHCVPGGQNSEGHSGTDNKSCMLYSDSRAREQTLRCIRTLIDKTSGYENIIGIQALNEPIWGTEKFLEDFYDEILSYAAATSMVPIYIGDGWNISHWAHWVGKRPEFCVLDHHYYYCFTSENHAMSTGQLIDAAEQSIELAHCSQIARGNVVVGEWSLALDPHSKELSREANQEYRVSEDRRRFGRVQLKSYTAGCGGSFFWTYKFRASGELNEWNFRDMIACGSLPASFNSPVSLSLDHVHGQFDSVSLTHFEAHCRYWSLHESKFEHWRYLSGFRTGWNDAIVFAIAGSRIGFAGEWTKRRSGMHSRNSDHSTFVWEFEHGFRAGLAALASFLH